MWHKPSFISVLHVLLHLAACATGQPPHFTQEPQDTVVYKTSLVLDCTAQGHPSPAITWYRGDPPALVSDGHVLNGSLLIPTVVEGVDASRGGIPYHCRATSDQFGTIRSRTATVYYAFFGEGKDITYSVKNTSNPLAEDTVALYCNVSWSNPPPSIIWVGGLNQTVPSNGTKFLYLEGGRYLAIIGVDPVTAQRVFHCKVTNVFGMLSVDSPTRSRFYITASPRTGLVIYKPLEDVTAYEGDTNVQFSMVAAGNGSISINCAITSGSSLHTTTLSVGSLVVRLVITGPVSLVDSGTEVTCQVFSSTGITSYTVTLTVLARANLVVTSSPGDSLDNSVGTNVSFTCEASGVGLGMRWYRNGEEVSPDPRVVISGFTMTIYGLLDGDSGMYQCSVSNGTSSVWRQWRVVVSNVVPIPIKESVVVVGGGGGTTLRVQVMSYPPPDHVQWYMNGSLVMSSDLYLISNISVSDNSTVPITYSASLTISSVNLTTQGFYLASFYGYVGVVNTSSIFVTFGVPAVVLGMAVPVCLKAGVCVQLACEVYGYPIPTVHFFKDNSSLPQDDHTHITSNTLTITNIQPQDGGVYSCSADNGVTDYSIGHELVYCNDLDDLTYDYRWIAAPVVVVVVVMVVVMVIVGVVYHQKSSHPATCKPAKDVSVDKTDVWVVSDDYYVVQNGRSVPQWMEMNEVLYDNTTNMPQCISFEVLHPGAGDLYSHIKNHNNVYDGVRDKGPSVEVHELATGSNGDHTYSTPFSTSHQNGTGPVAEYH